jgi:hypothetical protein
VFQRTCIRVVPLRLLAVSVCVCVFCWGSEPRNQENWPWPWFSLCDPWRPIPAVGTCSSEKEVVPSEVQRVFLADLAVKGFEVFLYPHLVKAFLSPKLWVPDRDSFGT